MHERRARDHFGVKARAPADEAQEKPAVPVGPVHHRRHAQTVRHVLHMFTHSSSDPSRPCGVELACGYRIHDRALAPSVDVAKHALETEIDDDGQQADDDGTLNDIGRVEAGETDDDRCAQTLAPTVEASAAVPMLMITDVRIPATMTGMASGNSMRRRMRAAFIPRPSAASRAELGTDSIPATVLCTMGSRPYSASAISAGDSPNPIMGAATASTATGGKVWPIATVLSTSGRNSRPADRVTKTAAPTPTTMAAALESATSWRCAAVSARSCPA
jgi:hypothetical protein